MTTDLDDKRLLGRSLFDWYLICGAILFFAFAYFGERRPDPEYWQEYAQYDPAMIEGGMIRGTVRYENAADCTAKARQRYHYEWVDIVGSKDVPMDGINGPFQWGCQKVDREGRRLQDIRR
jgi:hypothetical protein